MSRIYLTHVLLWQVLCLIFCGAISISCNRWQPDKAHNQTENTTRPLFWQTAGALNNPNNLQALLSTSFADMAQKLGSLQYRAQTSFTLHRGIETYTQADTYTLQQDAQGRQHIVLETPISQVEAYLINEQILVRYDKGQLRQKSRRDFDPDPWFFIATHSLQQSLPLFGKLEISQEPETTQINKRTALKYNFQLAKVNTSNPVNMPVVVDTHFPSALPAVWRELCKPLALRGSIMVDQQTGVVIKTVLDGQLDIVDATTLPTEITLHLEQETTQIGHLLGIVTPPAVSEFKRPVRNHDFLSFFRDQLPTAATSPK